MENEVRFLYIAMEFDKKKRKKKENLNILQATGAEDNSNYSYADVSLNPVHVSHLGWNGMTMLS